MLRAYSAGFCGSVNGDALPRHAQMLSKLVGGKNLIWTRMMALLLHCLSYWYNICGSSPAKIEVPPL